MLLIVIHIRISMPWLFRGWVQQDLAIDDHVDRLCRDWTERMGTAVRELPAEAGTDRLRYEVLVGPLEQTRVPFCRSYQR